MAGCAPATSGPAAPQSPPPTAQPTAQPAAPVGMVRIAGGEYPIGADDGPSEERPAHRVVLDAFAIDTFPVTTQQFVTWANTNRATLTNLAGGEPRTWTGPLSPLERNAVRDAGGREIFTTDDGDDDSRILRSNGGFAVEAGSDDHPVSEVYWWGAVRYCESRGARLPTEAEWEATARGAEGRAYPWGDAAPDATRAQFGRSYGETAPVGAHPAGTTPQGVQDLVGNLYEWTSSLDRPYPYDADDGREDLGSLQMRITRGGAHDSDVSAMRPTDRDGYSRDPFAGHHHIGFRCAADAS